MNEKSKKSKKKKQCSKFDDISKVAIEGAATETVQLYGTAGKEHLVAYSGIDNENDTELAKGLKQIAESNVNPNYKIQNIKQQAGFAAEVKYTARQNAEKTINKESTRYTRTDDVGRVSFHGLTGKLSWLAAEEPLHRPRPRPNTTTIATEYSHLSLLLMLLFFCSGGCGPPLFPANSSGRAANSGAG